MQLRDYLKKNFENGEDETDMEVGQQVGAVSGGSDAQHRVGMEGQQISGQTGVDQQQQRQQQFGGQPFGAVPAAVQQAGAWGQQNAGQDAQQHFGAMPGDQQQQQQQQHFRHRTVRTRAVSLVLINRDGNVQVVQFVPQQQRRHVAQQQAERLFLMGIGLMIWIAFVAISTLYYSGWFLGAFTLSMLFWFINDCTGLAGMINL